MSRGNIAIIALECEGKKLFDHIELSATPEVSCTDQTLSQLEISIENVKGTKLAIFCGNGLTLSSKSFAKSAKYLSDSGTAVVSLVLKENETCDLAKIAASDLMLSIVATNDNDCVNFINGVIDTLVVSITNESIIMLSMDDLLEMIKNSGNGYFALGTSNDASDRAEIAATAAIDCIASQIMEAKKVLVSIAGAIELEEFVTIGNLVKAFINDDAMAYVTTCGKQTVGNHLQVSIICV